ncbi:MAG: glycosyltransferase family 4 protein [Pseudomonadota bacterium]|nr:glycosyltransferase family 4 protein [Pseudomonadota bacterium]
MKDDTPTRLAVVLSHPTQYYSPWFRHIATRRGIELMVFYLWDFGVEDRYDPQFAQSLRWDIPLLDGYRSVFVPNRSDAPGTHHFGGLDNPGLVEALVEYRPDAILLFGYAYRSHIRVLLSPRLSRVPILLRGDSHDLARPPGWKRALARSARRLLFRRVAACLAVGHNNAQYFRNSGVPASRIHFVPHCVDNDRFQAAIPEATRNAAAWRTSLGIPGAACLVVFAGKFEPKKCPLDLLDAFIGLREAGQAPGAALLFVGSGALEGAMRERAGDLIGRSVFFAGFQNQTRMPMVYASADVFVLPSFGSGETWGLAVNEAMNMARPSIVSSHVGCAADLVRPGETGWVFAAGDVAALRAVLAEALATDAAGRARMGGNAQVLVREYGFDVATDALLAVLQTSLHGGAA